MLGLEIATPLLLLLLYMAVDTYGVRRCRKKVKWVIHVNGTRGKTTVTHMLDAAFRRGGYKTFSKVTGTYPLYRDCSGAVHHIRRNNATILEQKRILKCAAREGAEVLIVECMALQGHFQAYSDRILKADTAVITNVRTDHLEVMGLSWEQNADTLFKMTRVGQEVVVGDDWLYQRFGHLERVHRCRSFEAIPSVLKSNTDLVLEVALRYGLDEVATRECIEVWKAYPKTVTYRGNEVLFGFDMNDLESTTAFYRSYRPVGRRIIWFHDRADRPYRSAMFLIWLCEIKPACVVLSGPHICQNERRLRKYGFAGTIVDARRWADTGETILGVGNTKGLEGYIGGIDA